MMRRISIASCGLALLCLSFALFADPPESLEWPDTRAAEIARGYIESFNSNDLETLRTFATSYRTDEALAARPPEARAQQRLAMFAQLGALTPVAVDDATDTSIAITCRAEGPGMYLRLQVKLEDGPPHKLDQVEIAPTAPPSMSADGKTAPEPTWKHLEELLEAVLEPSGVPALAAVIVEGDQIVDVAAVGVRAADSTEQVTVQDRWHVGSITKSMTATMIGALVEEGVLAWDSTLGGVLGDVDMRDVYRDVTLAQLLRHVGGLPAYALLDEETERRLAGLSGTSTEQRATFIRQVLQEEPEAPIGTFSYSNAGYSIAGHMAERVAGKSWEALIQEHVFAPAGVKKGGFGWPASEDRPDQPHGHVLDSAGLRVQGIGEDELGDYLAPAGDVHLSITDLALYAIQHLQGLAGKDGIVDGATLRYLHQPSDQTSPTYACGWMVSETDDGTVHAHGGSAGTFYAQLELYPETQRALAIVTNVGTQGIGVVQQIGEEVRQRWRERE